MSYNRRTFLKNSSLFFGSILLYGNKSFNNLVEPQRGFRILRDTIGTYTEKGGTIGCYIDEDIVIAVDSQFPDSAENFFKEMKKRSENKFTYLFNTHHHKDHTSGNAFLKKYSNSIIAHINCPRLQLKNNQNDGKEIVTADMMFDTELKFRLPKERISAIHFGQAHTGGDILVHFENADVAHLGDLVFNNVFPYIDNEGECSVENWIKVLDKITDYFSRDTAFIFGHADSQRAVIGNKNDLIKMRNYLEALYNYVSQQISLGKSVEEISEYGKIPDSHRLTELWKGAAKMNLEAAASQIRRKM